MFTTRVCVQEASVCSPSLHSWLSITTSAGAPTDSSQGPAASRSDCLWLLTPKSTVPPKRPNGKHVDVKFKEQLKRTVGVSGLQCLQPFQPFFPNSSFFSSGSVTSNKRSVLSNHALLVPSPLHTSPISFVEPEQEPQGFGKVFFQHDSIPAQPLLPLPFRLPLTSPSCSALQIQCDNRARDVFVSMQQK